MHKKVATLLWKFIPERQKSNVKEKEYKKNGELFGG